MLCSSLYANLVYYDNDISLYYSFLARGKHLHCIRCRVHVQQLRRREKKMLTEPKSLFNLRIILLN